MRNAFHGKELNELRESMLNGKKHPACNVCWKMEKGNNKNSYRLHSSRPSEKIDFNNLKLTTFDLGFEETCNLRCRMCTPGNSNQLRLDLKYFKKNNYTIDSWLNAHGDSGQHQVNSENMVKNSLSDSKQWKSILDNITDINVIKATGGETLLTKSFNQFLDVAIEKNCAKNIVLEFHTNATVFTSKLMKKLNHFNKINIAFSIDSVGKRYEYIRYPMKWELLEKSVKKFIQMVDKSKVHILSFNSVGSVFSAFNYRELCEWIYQLGLQNKLHVSLWVDQIIPENKSINITYLPHSLLKELLIEYEYLTNQYNSYDNMIFNCENIINMINNTLLKKEDNFKDKMLYEIKAFDSSRNQDYHNFVHPKLIEFLDGK